MARRLPRQLELPSSAGWGGRRPGAGRKATAHRPSPSHKTRQAHDPRTPVHVTLRASAGVPSLRSDALFRALRRALAAASLRSFRVVHFSVQTDHIHLIVEADSHKAFRRGIRGLAIRCALAVNRTIGRKGRLWNHRYHAHALGTPREVRAALVYVLLNFRKHLRAGPGIDPRSSGRWFDGWRNGTAPDTVSPVAAPRTWLCTVGWRRAGGPIDLEEAPLPGRRVARRDLADLNGR
jgi:REP element-mobilizing transposase RayT